MRPRQEITEMFSTFAQLEKDRFSNWLTDRKLQRSIQNCLNEPVDITTSENFWALYWHKNWLRQSSYLAEMHLSAYLQEPCYWAAEKIVRRFTNTQYELADYFQMAIAEVKTILNDFDSNKNSSLKTYACMAFSSRLKDILRQRKEADICTNWGLLRKVSKKLLLEALHNAGLSPTQIAQYRLAWICFKTIYIQKQPGGINKLLEPNRQLWEAVSNLYNTERQSQLTPAGPEYDYSSIEQLLTYTGICVRAYLYPTITSLDVPKPNQESSFILDLPDPSAKSLVAEIIAQEDARNRQEQLLKIDTVLLTALKQLDSQSQEIVKLYYKQEFTQQQIIQQLQISQPTVSRRLIKARESLLAALILWSQQTLNISVTSNLIKDISAALEEWLKIKYVRY
ncbi:sigma-70 family RNA polymerase sigma factor [Nostoc sp. S13]|uniref:sigma-70 family RNA polymerase sigma factor n=1 Tax=Nostoc sp. S13 TaxID=3019266 RepID=UPI002612EDCE|nr:sigma-70 family RNA polymerase sigma factor [Nostoc sp. S13]MDF5740352.1 sigma-70 family RNA polymerase sigma factor [Nostoc sp. S13]